MPVMTSPMAKEKVFAVHLRHRTEPARERRPPGGNFWHVDVQSTQLGFAIKAVTQIPNRLVANAGLVALRQDRTRNPHRNDDSHSHQARRDEPAALFMTHVGV